MTAFYWREWVYHGGQVVSPEFDTPAEAGRWRLDHPPLQGACLPVLWKRDEHGERRVLPSELVEAYDAFALVEFA